MTPITSSDLTMIAGVVAFLSLGGCLAARDEADTTRGELIAARADLARAERERDEAEALAYSLATRPCK